ncbi:MAG: YhjD/YihY/BrkB family envelope integrity protein [Candidatus Electryoneaceae bacterium]|nr:YhjD/YihY/BrkB family envelope integrity protein [Candidatus Electryoneaceae bacterium]
MKELWIIISIRIADLLNRHSQSQRWYGIVVRTLIGLYRFTKITLREYLDDRLLLRAMGLTFGSLFALIPLLIISFSIFKVFGGGEWFMEMLQPVLERNLTPGSGPVVAQWIEGLLLAREDTAMGGIGLIFFIFVVFGIFSAIEGAFNIIWDTSSPSGTFRRLSHYWGLVTVIPIMVVSSLALTTYLKALPLVHRAVETVGFDESLISRTLPVLLVMLSFFLLYRFLPNARVRTYAALVGSVIAVLLYEAVKAGFILYTGKVVRYDIIYGSLAILPLVIVWINLSWIIVLLGVEICFVTQHYQILLSKRKHVKFSRRQKDALAYQILLQVTLAFRGKRNPVTIEEWNYRYNVPLSVISGIVNKLASYSILEKVGRRGERILLARDPDYILISDVDNVLSGETFEEWNWPDEPNWKWIREWIKHQYNRNVRQDIDDDTMTLNEFVSNFLAADLKK